MYFDRLNATICSLATAPGSSIGIIRISGDLSFKIASSLTGIKSFNHMKAIIVRIKNEKGIVVEKCLLLPFKSPKSYTGEDIVELHLHGSTGNSKDILSIILKLGAIPSLKGEFSFRAVMNLKMNLNEAIALNTLISSSNPFAIELSRKAAFENKLIEKIKSLISEWEYFYTLTTAIIDYPDQVSESLPQDLLLKLMDLTTTFISPILDNSKMLEKIINYSILILGKPNVGKSSLFNILINHDRAIVSDVPGTTRDYILEPFVVKGIQVNLIDSAGIRNTSSALENEGINKSRNLIKQADLLLLVFDSSQPLDNQDFELLNETLMIPRILLRNKSDINQSEPEILNNSLKISCKFNIGITELLNEVYTNICKNLPDQNNSVFFHHWQKAVAKDSLELIKELQNIVKSDQIEIIQFSIKNIYLNLKSLSGEIISQNTYDKIFDDFCLGK